ncbi:MAG: cadherin-like beta sandwich domain-containing protein, partial [Paludibacteraceae bacterium]
RMDTTLLTGHQLTRRITVTAESGRTAVYTVAYERLLSDADTLQMILLDDKPLEGFRADSTFYLVTLAESAERLPVVTYIEGNEGQTVTVNYEAVAYSTDSVAQITVRAANGNTRVYTVRFTRALSHDTHLQMIYIDGTPLTNFDEEKYTYRIPLPVEVTVLPMVTAEKKEPAQQVTIRRDADTVRVAVVAADTAFTATYTLVFEHLKSDNTLLADLRLQYTEEGAAAVALTPAFAPEHYDYAVTLPYGVNDLPTILPVKSDEEQTVEISAPQVIGEGTAQQAIITITVTAPNEEDQAAYTITFTFAQNDDARLTAIYLRGELLAGFHPDTLEYTLSYPAHSTEEDFANASDVRAELSDSLATLDLSMDDAGTILLSVTAQDGSNRTYSIRQQIMLDTDNALRMIYLDDTPLANFDPEQEFYIHYLVEGMTPPAVTAEAVSDLAEISIREVAAGDTCMVICTSESGESRRYQIWFAVSETNDAATPTPNDVLVKRLNGSYQLLFATTRKDVSIGVYNAMGRLVALQKVPTANPNDVSLATDSYGNEVLMDVSNVESGVLMDFSPNEIYFYTFFLSDREVIRSGKIVLL